MSRALVSWHEHLTRRSVISAQAAASFLAGSAGTGISRDAAVDCARICADQSIVLEERARALLVETSERACTDGAP